MSYTSDPTQPVRRHSTTLFADVCDSTSITSHLDPEEAHEIIRACIGRLERIARRHGAALVNYRGDAILATFGIPIPQEEAGRAALNAAIEMRERISELGARYSLPIRVSIGVASGVLVAGDVSGSSRVEIDVAGDAANLAARLSDRAAPDQILVSPSTRSETVRDFRFESAGVQSFKGVEAPTEVYSLLDDKPRLHRRGPASTGPISSAIVDRLEVMQTLSGRLEELAGGRGSVVCLHGAPGLGKSRLALELRAQAVRVTWLQGRCLQIGGSLPYHPFREILRDWAHVAEDEGSSSLQRMREALGQLALDISEETVATLGNVAGIPLEGELLRRLEEVPNDAAEHVTWMALRRWLTLIARQEPIVLALDDLHWADAASLRALEALLPLAAREPILFLLIFRTDEELNEVRSIAKKKLGDQHVDLVIEPLTGSETAELLGNFVSGGVVPRSTCDLLIERSSGVPFVLEELLHSMIEGGALSLSEVGLETADESVELQVPVTVQDAFLSRLDRLPPLRKEILEAASVMGRSFHLPALAEIFPDKATLTRELDQLIGQRILSREETRMGLEFRFRHPLSQEITYESMTRKRRRALHVDVAQAMELHFSDNRDGLAGVLAYHFGKGGQLARAEDYLMKAGEHAARTAASDEALRFFELASEVLLQSEAEDADPERRIRIQRQLAFAYFNRGRLAESNAHFASYLGLRGERAPGSRAAQILRVGRIVVALAVASRARLSRASSAKASAVDAEVIEVMFARARAETQSGQGDFLFHSLDTLAKIREFDPHTIPNAGGMLGAAIGIFTFGGLSSRISEYVLQQGREFADPEDDREQMLLQGMGFIHQHFLGDWSDEHVLDEGLVERALSGGSLWDVTTYWGLLAKQRVHQGRYLQARALLGSLEQIEDEYAYALARETRLAVSTLLAMEIGARADALEFSDLHLSELNDDAARLFALGNRVKCLTLDGRLDDASELLGETLSIASKQRWTAPFQRISFQRAQLIVHAESPAKTSKRTVRRVSRAARRTIGKVAAEGPEVLRLVGELQLQAGGRKRALAFWAEGIAAGERLKALPELGRLYGRAAEVLVNDGDWTGPDRASCARRAAEIDARLDEETKWLQRERTADAGAR